MRYSSRNQGWQIGHNNQQNNSFNNRKIVISLGAFGVALVLAAGLFLFAAPIMSLVEEIRTSIASVSRTPNFDEGPQVLPARAKVSLNPRSGAKSDLIRVTGENFEPGEDVSVTVHSYEAALVQAGSDGSFSTSIRIPGDTFCPSNQCRVMAQGKDNLEWNDATYTLR